MGRRPTRSPSMFNEEHRRHRPPALRGAQAIQLVDDFLADGIAQRGDLFDVPAIDGDGLQYPKIDILGGSKKPGVAGQSGAGAFHHQRQYGDLLANGQVEWTLVERQHPAIARAGSFGEENHGNALAQVARALQHGFGALAPVGAVDGHVAGPAEHPAQKRKPEHLRLAEPFGIQPDEGNYGDIGQGLMIAHDHVHLVGGHVFTAGNMDPPGVDFGQDGPQVAEPAARSQPSRVGVEQPDRAQQRDPKYHQSRGGSPNPGGSQVANHISVSNLWNMEMPATPAAPVARHSAALRAVMPPKASTGMATARTAWRKRSRPCGGP